MRVRFLFVALTFLLSGCPRGETNTLDEVLNSARERFEAFSSRQVPDATRQQLSSVASGLKGFVDSADASLKGEQAAILANQLEQMLNSASYTVRPALTEVISQLRDFSNAGPDAPADAVARAKLLAARAYWALAGELETTGFRVL